MPIDNKTKWKLNICNKFIKKGNKEISIITSNYPVLQNTHKEMPHVDWALVSKRTI